MAKTPFDGKRYGHAGKWSPAYPGRKLAFGRITMGYRAAREDGEAGNIQTLALAINIPSHTKSALAATILPV